MSIKADVARELVATHISISCHSQVAHLAPVYRLLWRGVVGIGSGLYLHNDQSVTIGGQGRDVQVAMPQPPITVTDAVSFALQIRCSLLP